MTPFKPALVYTPGSDADRDRRINGVLEVRRRHRLRLSQEADADLCLPVHQRPILRRLLFDAQSRLADTFVTDHLDSLGKDQTSQVAVVGTLMQLGLKVLVMNDRVPDRWYREGIADLGFPAVDAIMRQLLDVHTLVDLWPSVELVAFGLSPAESKIKVRDLIDREQLSYTRAAARLNVDGYRNSEGRVLWYHKAVRDAYESGL